MDLLSKMCDQACLYPKNLILESRHVHNLDAIQQRLSSHAHRLFTKESEAAVNIMEFDNGGAGLFAACWKSCTVLNHIDFWTSPGIASVARLKSHLRIASTPKCADPWCRFL